ncbi:hypothetical protein T440DRAFT_247212 [Plenodomus tracheiphilus IPT5]|uniref:WW domain-containing protein n=1 Tax=Plenodomus tracheiphilus IPT5 TaxID=1408161 RepID=A0A6A7AV47_9PLEO|nr:hypothetical protein T440DRAFT_247212 [Plenodomus tracheiphilus IPT5]
MSIETALQRADQYIQKQMHKFEQQKRGRASPPRAYAGYGQLPPQQDYSHGRRSSQNYGSPAPPPHPLHQGPAAPSGWRQEFDTRNQRWYYINLSTGRSQWEPPNPQHSQAPPPRSQTFSNEPPQHREHNRWSQQRERAVSQPQRPMSSSSGGQYLGVDHPDRNASSVSPHPSPSGRLPPGAHLDLKTGQVVTSMFPPGQDANSWAQEVGRV